MEKIGEDEDSIFYTADFEGHQIGLMMDKRTKEILLNADDLIKLCGLGEAFTDFLGISLFSFSITAQKKAA